MRIKVAPMAASELDVQMETLDIETDPQMLDVLRRWRGGALEVEPGADLWSIVGGLTGLANGCDEWAARHDDPEQRRFYRAARDGLSAAATRVADMTRDMKNETQGAG